MSKYISSIESWIWLLVKVANLTFNRILLKKLYLKSFKKLLKNLDKNQLNLIWNISYQNIRQ